MKISVIWQNILGIWRNFHRISFSKSFFNVIYPDRLLGVSMAKKILNEWTRDLTDPIRDLRLTKPNAELLIHIQTEEMGLGGENCAGDMPKGTSWVVFKLLQIPGWTLLLSQWVWSIWWIVCNPDKWRLFTDSLTRSQKVALLNNGNKCPTIPLAYSGQINTILSSYSNAWSLKASKIFMGSYWRL